MERLKQVYGDLGGCVPRVLAGAAASNEVRYEQRWVDDAELVVVAFGTAARVAQSAVREAQARGMNIGLFRPVSLWPFPYEPLRALSVRTKRFLVVEMNAGQMVEDVRLAVGSNVSVSFYGRVAGFVPMPDEIIERIEELELAKYPVGAA